jgi:lysophospholipase
VTNRDSLFLFQHVASTDKQIKIYGGLFHEILNEYVRDEVIGDMIRWMKLRV